MDVVDPELLRDLVCPETRQGLRVAEAAWMARIDAAQAAGRLKNRSGEIVEEKVDAALIRDDGKVLYPILAGIPVLLIEQGILTADLTG